MKRAFDDPDQRGRTPVYAAGFSLFGFLLADIMPEVTHVGLLMAMWLSLAFVVARLFWNRRKR